MARWQVTASSFALRASEDRSSSRLQPAYALPPTEAAPFDQVSPLMRRRTTQASPVLHARRERRLILDGLTQRSKGGANFRAKQRRLLPRGEVAAFVDL